MFKFLLVKLGDFVLHVNNVEGWDKMAWRQHNYGSYFRLVSHNSIGALIALYKIR